MCAELPQPRLLPTSQTRTLRHGQNPLFCLFFKIFIYLFFKKGEGREKGEEKYRRVTEASICYLLHAPARVAGIWPTTQACVLTGNRTSDLSVCGRMPNLLSHTSQAPLLPLEDRVGGSETTG